MLRSAWIALVALTLAASACGKDANGNNTNAQPNNSNGNNTTGTNGNNTTMGTNGTNGTNGMSNNSNNNGTNNMTTMTLGPLTAETWTQELVRAYCDAAFDCPGTDFYLFEGIRYYLNTYGSKEACKNASAEIAQLFGDAELIDAVMKGRLDFDATAGAGCLDAYRADACGEDADPAACDGVFTGLVGDAQNCQYSDECSNPDSACQPIMGTCFGACGPDLCGSVQCGANEFCDTSDTCVALENVGETCDLGGCVDGATCNYDATAMSGTCVADGSVAAGGYCWLSSVCIADHFCDFSDDTCQPYKQAGESCDFGDCVDPLVCNVDFDTNMGTCITEGSVAQGQKCVDSTVCMDGLYCDIDTDTCETADKPEGADCTFSTECAGELVCNFLTDSGTCAQPKSVAAGGPCGVDEVCMDGLSCDYFGTETCRGLGAAGDGCNDGSVSFFPVACQPGLACLTIDPNSGEGTCGALVAAGGACQDFTQCAAPNTCVGGMCQPRLADGGSCESALQCESLSCNDATMACDPSAICMVP